MTVPFGAVCWCCGKHTGLREVLVRPCAGGRLERIALCRGCREGNGIRGGDKRAWRFRYDPVRREPQEAA